MYIDNSDALMYALSCTPVAVAASWLRIRLVSAAGVSFQEHGVRPSKVSPFHRYRTL